METINVSIAVTPASVTKENSIWYGGGLFSYLTTGEQTGGRFALVHSYIRKGSEPPPHMHSREDESFYLLEGEARFSVGDKQFTAGPGDFVYMPKNIFHSFKLKTDTARALLHVSPAGFEQFFIEMGKPAESLSLPPLPAPPTAAQVEQLKEISSHYGVQFQQPAGIPSSLQ